jgi:hypothetical protein
MPTDRRHPHQRFDRSLISGFLRGREILSAALLPTGKSNTNYKLVLGDGGTCILRLYSRGCAERETYVMNLVKELVPVPLELAHGENWSMFSFAVFSIGSSATPALHIWILGICSGILLQSIIARSNGVLRQAE